MMQGNLSEESHEAELIDASLFTEPANYRQPPPPPNHVTHTLLSGRTLQIRLVGSSPLWVRSHVT